MEDNSKQKSYVIMIGIKEMRFALVLLVVLCVFCIIIQMKHSAWYTTGTQSREVIRASVERSSGSQHSAWNDTDMQSREIIQSSVPQSSPPSDRKHERAQRKLMVVYKPYQGRFQRQIREFNMTSCVASNCDVYLMTGETRYPINADAIIFQGNRIPPNVPNRSDNDQVYVFADTEPPHMAHSRDAVKMIHQRPDFYNWTLTYKPDSDIWTPYGMVIPSYVNKLSLLQDLQQGIVKRFENKRSDGLVNRNYDAIFNSKTKHALWFVSHCYTRSKRETYVARMTTVTNVEIYGRCKGLRIKGNDAFDNAYKFYLAFENTLCEDYITEKFFSWYSKDLIVVVRGGANYSKFVPEGTYINAADFPSPEALADFLNKLGSDKTRYLGYLKRKDHYHVITEQETVQNAFCAVCWRLNHLKQFRNSQKTMSKWWFQSCHSPLDL